MDGVKQITEMLRPWIAYLDYCFNQYPAAAVCEPFWTRTIGAVVIVGLIAVAVGVWKYLKYRRDFRAAIRAYDERMAIADAETMKENTWAGDNAYRKEMPDADVAKRIREALDARRRGDDATPGSRGA